MPRRKGGFRIPCRKAKSASEGQASKRKPGDSQTSRRFSIRRDCPLTLKRKNSTLLALPLMTSTLVTDAPFGKAPIRPNRSNSKRPKGDKKQGKQGKQGKQRTTAIELLRQEVASGGYEPSMSYFLSRMR
jgi:hypothetical protein